MAILCPDSFAEYKFVLREPRPCNLVGINVGIANSDATLGANCWDADGNMVPPTDIANITTRLNITIDIIDKITKGIKETICILLIF